MKTMIRIAATIVLVFLSVSSARAHYRTLYFTIKQDHKTISVRDDQTIILERKPFEFIFPLSEYGFVPKGHHAVQIAASLKSEILKYSTGTRTADIPFFTPGTGMAVGHNTQYGGIYLTRRAHHYIFIDNEEPGDRRAKILSDLSDGDYEVSWEIKALSEGENKLNEVPVSAFSPDRIYIFFFQDLNHNEVLDPGEFIRFSIQFKNRFHALFSFAAFSTESCGSFMA